MRKFKRVAASALAVAMATTMMAGCSSDSNSTTAASTEAEKTTANGSEAATTAPDGTDAPQTEAPQTEAPQTEAPTPAEDEGDVLNIYCWNNEFATRMLLYPGYEAKDEADPLQGGKIGDVTVNFIQIANEDNAYQNALDAALDAQEDASANDIVDMFLVEADYALKYVDTPYTLDVYSLPGLSEADTADQYKYTQDIMTDSEGVLKGLSWQGCPGLLFYNREIATEVLGSDDADTVQAAVKDWATFNETAAKVKEKGYYMEPSVNDSFRVYQNNAGSPWVVDGKVVVDDNLKAWVDDSKALLDAGCTTNDALWDGYNNATNGGTFCAFGPAWLINFCFGFKEENPDSENVAEAGKWGAVNGPQGFYWGGTWMCAAAGTDNATLVGSIMKTMTCDVDVMKQIVTDYDDFVNNKAAMEEMADSDYTSYILGGMNPLGLYAEGADKISLDNLTGYDQGCNEEFQNAMKSYFAGDASYEDALDAFYTAITTKYPALSVEVEE